MACRLGFDALARGVLAVTAAGAPAGCSSLTRLPSVPRDQQYAATVPGLPGIRYRAPQVEALMDDLRTTVERERAVLRADGYRGPLLPISFLAVSGGGENGTFGAGLPVGWTERGDRPEFNIVTGVSTGALIAPFAFLGPKYDAQLKRLYTEISAMDVMELRGMVGALFDGAMADNLPLKNLVEANITQEVLDAIAAESKKGRMLLVSTTERDAQRSAACTGTSR